MKIIHLSDSHSSPIKCNIEKIEGNLLIHSGDIGGRGTIVDVEKAVKDLALFKEDFDEIILIPGNHDWAFERSWDVMVQVCKDADIILLNDSGFEFNGIKIWGSPITPWFRNWAFNRYRGQEIKKHWDMIPLDTQILITHGPPYEILDVVNRGGSVGCQDLSDKIKELKDLKLHLFGHIHESAGQTKIDGVTYSNGCLLDEYYDFTKQPNIFEWDKL